MNAHPKDAAVPPPGEALGRLFEKRVVVLDGAMGSMIQTHGLGEADFRGSRFAGIPAT